MVFIDGTVTLGAPTTVRAGTSIGYRTNSNAEIVVGAGGSLVVEGLTASRVRIRPDDLGASGQWGWQGITIGEDATADIRFVEIRGATFGLSVLATNASVLVRDSAFDDCAIGVHAGLLPSASPGALVVDHCRLDACDTGIAVTNLGAASSVSWCIVTNVSGVGVSIASSTGLAVTNCNVVDCGSWAVAGRGVLDSCYLADNNGFSGADTDAGTTSTQKTNVESVANPLSSPVSGAGPR
jgi:hypothetical protein